MRGLLLSTLIVAAFGLSSTGQTIIPCHADEQELLLQQKYPQIAAEQIAFQQFIAEWIENNKDNADVREDDAFIIPVVYHIIHDYGTENISDDQVRDDLRVLNLEWNRMNADTSSVIPEFKDIIGDMNVEFRLANKNPGGQCTNGIEHIPSLSTYNGGEASKLNPWPRSMYLNIWTVKSLPSEPGSVLLAYAFQPSTAALPFLAPYDGIISRSDAIGTIGSAVSAYQGTITHEVGHFFGLNHPWTSVNGPIGVECGDDGVDDTPLTEGWFSICPLPANSDVCTTDVEENYQNFMDYASCTFMFTEGQVLVVHGALNAPAAQRNLLWSESNLIATGTEDTIQDQCLPRVDFFPSARMACVGASVTFNDVSWGGEVSSRSWTFPDGNPASSTEKNPVVTFSAPGYKTITLSVTNSLGTVTESREQFIYISEDAGQLTVGFNENFEDANSVVNNYVVQNREGNGSKWQHSSAAGYLSSSSIYLNNLGNLAGDIDNFSTPSFDLSGGGPLYLNYRIACATNTANPDLIDDVLKIYSSTDCGKVWVVRSTVTGVSLANAGFYGSSFIPPGVAQWTGRSVLLPSAVYDSNVRFRFEYTTNGSGNNVYIDDINISGFPVGVNDPQATSFELDVFPNPVAQTSTVSLTQRFAGDVTLKVMDQSGRVLLELFSGRLNEGVHNFQLDASALNTNGLYFLVAEDGLTIRREKIVVQ
jgi:PKD repeat protein